MSEPLLLSGLNGGNPLAFLALLGVATTTRNWLADARISWVHSEGKWCPRLHGYDDDAQSFAQRLGTELHDQAQEPFAEMDKKLPYSRDVLHAHMARSLVSASSRARRIPDLLAAFGTDAFADDKGIFIDTAFRMVRSGDSAGQGLPAYAVAIRKAITVENLHRALFTQWRYEDEDFNLRWDPIEDQRYALRWYDPSATSSKKQNLKTMRGANVLALEGLALLPVQPFAQGGKTTGFSRLERRRDFFTWPIWETPLSIDGIRSLLSYPDLAEKVPNRDGLRAMGVIEIFRCERIAANQYYKNFTPARPV